MTYRPPLSPKQLLQCLQIRAELLVKPFNRFLLLPRAQRRHGYQIPGPLEYQRRAAKRRHGAVSAASGGGLPLQDFGTLFGFKLTEAPRPDFEKSWTWEAPVHGAAALAPRQKDHGDWRPWMRSPARAIKERQQQTTAEDFLDELLAEDPVDASRAQFETLLNSYGDPQTLDVENLREALDFLQSAANEPDARLTLRLVQWLAQRDMPIDCSQTLAEAVAQKYTLRTMGEDEGAAVLMELLQRPNALTLIPSMLDKVPTPRLVSVSENVTAAILAASVRSRETLDLWVRCLIASASTADLAHNTNEIWAAVYGRIAQHYRIADLAEHFKALDEKDAATVVLKHWVPNWVAGGSTQLVLPDRINFKSNPVGWVDGEWHSQLRPNVALADMVGTLAAHNTPGDTVLEEVFAYWQKTLRPETIVRAVYELQLHEVTIPVSLATSTIRFWTTNDAVISAFSLLRMLRTTPVEPFQDLLVKYLQSEKPHGGQIWPLIDRWVDMDSVANWKDFKDWVPQTIVDFVHEMARMWARSPHLDPRVAFRRVWECHRFLHENRLPFYPSLSGSAVRAGIINYIQHGKPLPKDGVRFVLNLVEQIEGQAVKQRADKMVFDYWKAFRHYAQPKPRSRVAREKHCGLQYVEEKSTWTFRGYKPRVQRRNSSQERRNERRLLEAGEAIDTEGREDYGTNLDFLGEKQNIKPEALPHDNASPDSIIDSSQPQEAPQAYGPFSRVDKSRNWEPTSNEERPHATPPRVPTATDKPSPRSPSVTVTSIRSKWAAWRKQRADNNPRSTTHNETRPDLNAAAEMQAFYEAPEIPVLPLDNTAQAPVAQLLSQLIDKVKQGGPNQLHTPGISSSNDAKTMAKRSPTSNARSQSPSEQRHKAAAAVVPPRKVRIHKHGSTNSVFDFVLDESNRPADPQYLRDSPAKRAARELYAREASKLHAREVHDRLKEQRMFAQRNPVRRWKPRSNSV